MVIVFGATFGEPGGRCVPDERASSGSAHPSPPRGSRPPYLSVQAQPTRIELDKERYARLFSSTSQAHDSVGGLFAQFGSLLVERAGLKPGERVLDIAAGTGASLMPAAQRVGAAGVVVGVDIAPGMVAELKDVIEAAKIDNTEALVADAEELPFADCSFDAVTAALSVRHPVR